MAKPSLLDKMPISQSPLGRMVLGLNLLGLFVLIVGLLVLNEFRQGLINTQQDSLTAQAVLTSEVIAEVATVGVPYAHLEPDNAAYVLARFIPKGQRARLFDAEGRLLSDSYVVSENVDESPLPPTEGFRAERDGASRSKTKLYRARSELSQEVNAALKGDNIANVRLNEKGAKVVSVSVPLRRVKAVLGVLTLEGGDVDEIVTKQRLALMPFILVALGVTTLSSILMHALVSQPIRHLSEAADQVSANKTRSMSLPDIEKRQDEIGALARSLEFMTESLSKRMDEIERFAADVSHEIKNPLTSIRSALETLDLVKDEAAKRRLMEVIKHDVLRLDRLITDISNASRLDAELSRDIPKPLNIVGLLDELVGFYNQTGKETDAKLQLEAPENVKSVQVLGREGPFGQVFRNLIDNARSFSPPGTTIKIKLALLSGNGSPNLLISIEDQGAGIPEENLKTIFERFYTSRPKGSGFGKNSGLGLSIVKQIIEAHNGVVWAENITDPANSDASSPIRGARFCIRLPGVA